jgi:hypothetical protein
MTFEIPQESTLEPGTYKAQLVGTSIKSGGKFVTPVNPEGKYRVWDWAVEKDGELVPFSDTTSINNGSKTKSYARLTALLGKAPQAGDKIEDPTGKTVMLQVVEKENGFAKVEAVLPFAEPQQTLDGVPR